VPAGKELVREGDYSYDVLAIEEGTARVERGRELVADLGPGDVAGEMGVLERSQRNATVVATSPMLLVTLTTWDNPQAAQVGSQRGPASPRPGGERRHQAWRTVGHCDGIASAYP
jgi:Cyclic nucleotide-binding domain